MADLVKNGQSRQNSREVFTADGRSRQNSREVFTADLVKMTMAFFKAQNFTVFTADLVIVVTK